MPHQELPTFIKIKVGNIVVNKLETNSIILVSFDEHPEKQFASDHPEKPAAYEVKVYGQGYDHIFYTRSPADSRKISDSIEEAQNEGNDLVIELDQELNA